jgi:hypothetical protein
MTPAENFERLRRTGATRRGYFRCPECSDRRQHHKRTKCLSVKEADDGIGLVFNCHHCQFGGYAADPYATGYRVVQKSRHKRSDFGQDARRMRYGNLLS